MQLEKIDLNKLEINYGIPGKILNMSAEPVYCGSMLGVLMPGESTRYHAHHEYERFVILRGCGTISNHKENLNIASGDIIYLTPGEEHVLCNKGEINFEFITTWWAEAQGAVVLNTDEFSTEAVTAPQIIIATPPTPNGDLHLGHLAGPYLAADILKRFLTLLDIPNLFLTGSDDHQSYVSLKANQSQEKPEQIADKYAIRIAEVFNQFHIHPDLFYRSLHNNHYIDFVQKYFEELFSKMKTKAKEHLRAYCETCQIWLCESQISGLCPHCHSPCGGLSCETCAQINSCIDIVDSYCKYCRTKPITRQCCSIYIVLEEYRKPLTLYLEQLCLPAHNRALVRAILANPLPDIPITHPSEWGIPVSIKGFEQQKICSWCELAPAYIFAVNALLGSDPEKINNEWINGWNNNSHNITITFGFDNSFCYLVLLPCLFIAYDKDIKLPKNIISNEYYLFEQLKFSTSRNHAVWAKDIIQMVDSDVIRYFLAQTRPETSRTQFSYPAFISLVNQDLVYDLSAWIIDLAQRLEKDFNNCCPDSGVWNIEHQEFIRYLQFFVKEYIRKLNPSSFSPHSVIGLLRELINQAKNIASNAVYLRNSLYLNKIEYQSSIVLELTALKYYALASAPIMPKFSKQLLHSLKLSLAFNDKEIRLLPPGTIIKNLSNCVFKLLTLESMQTSA